MRLGVDAALVGGRLLPGDVDVADGCVVGVGLARNGDKGRGVAAPGFIDLQVNGFGGIDFLAAETEDYAVAGDALLETGVTAYLPTFITSPEEDLVRALRAIPSAAHGPRIIGAHLEGPFISPRRLGTHPAAARRDPDPALLGRLLDAGPVRLVTLAPELPGAIELLDELAARGIAVSCGHSDATAPEASAAFDAGIRTVTHLYNAMRPFTHRDPGILGAALIRDDVILQLIVDGVHLAPEAVLLAWAAAPDRIALVTDAIAAAGLTDGSYALGSVAVDVLDGVVRREDGVLAGSALTMVEAVRNVHALGIPLEDALRAAGEVPARIVGEPTLGRLDVGLPADIVVLDDGLAVERVLVGGETLVAC